jgi:colicin import membrane protein
VKQKPGTPPALDKPPQPGGIRAVVLAVLVHAAFFALIVFGVTWQSSPTAPVQAEIWDKLPPVKGAPAKPDPTPPPVEPAKPEPPKPEPPKPEPPKPEPPRPAPKPEPKPPDTAIAEKVEREKKQREKVEREQAQRDKAEREKAETQKRERLVKQQEEDARKKREDDKRRRDEDVARKAAEQAREAATAARRSEVDKFTDAIKAKIRGRANVPDTVAGKPSVQVRIRILPGGEVLDIAVTRSSGNRVYDTAIERAIRSASPLPVPAPESELFPQFRDLILNIEHDR